MVNTIFLSIFGTGGKPIKDLAYFIEENIVLIDLLEELNGKNMLPKRFRPTDDFQDILVFVNRENIKPRKWSDSSLNHGDRVVVLSAAAGG